ncbi:GNAT family N-acetyltransferase [Halalkalibacter sp. APA_J-10(15)]|uniref:GNAT family N-acetyltransferase n=1 Tax=unclassified Halalkalibacter TaxID=2893063 RepID=UPI001FF32406|nr:GNAT family N-acetyltransferase [Halalkalibacter sp. APA_J-10(15)]MCK0471040.1 GNAT family N-acetyltransferase [Halalkalibacter sp. APA_J-10(15)]
MSVHIRDIENSKYDLVFLTDMMYEAIHIPENKPPKEELLHLPQNKIYSEGWGRQGDRALVAVNEEGIPVGAAWYRLFTGSKKGYGYVNDQTPELGIALTKGARGKRFGTQLMTRLFEEATNDGYAALSLSVDPQNYQALKLYQKLGFKRCGLSGTSWTMIYELEQVRCD